MALLGKLLGGLFGKGDATASDDGTYYYVRCQKCGEKIRVRVARWDLCEDFEGDGDAVSGYTSNKDVVGQKCFRTIHISLKFDRSRREVSRSCSGGDFITREEFEAADESDVSAKS